MPELPEVQTIVAGLRPHIAGVRITAIHLLRKDILTPADAPLASLLQNRVITEIDRRGKFILFTLDNTHRFSIHLGMTGQLTLTDPSTPAPKHTHLRLHLSHDLSHSVSHLLFTDPRRFGGIRWLGPTGQVDADMGPEPLTLRPAQLARLLSKTTRPIKSALLDQKLIAGLGNIYADEALHAAGIHPLTPANHLSPAQSAKLCRSIKLVLRRALHHKGSTLRDYHTPDGAPGNFQKLHRVYARTGRPCLTCKTPIERLVLTGRSAHFCPKCQRM